VRHDPAMTTRTADRALADLRDAVRELLDPIQRKVLRDGGVATAHTAPSRLVQLRRASSHSGQSGRASSGSGTRMPIDAGAVDLLGQIAAAAAQLHREVLAYRAPTVEMCIQLIVALVERWDDVAAIDTVAEWMRSWRDGIDEQLDPRHVYHLKGPCPACGVRMASRADGERTVQVHALLVDSREGCMCQACGAHWRVDQLDHLNLVLEQQSTQPSTRS
jgi:hypothetical protein